MRDGQYDPTEIGAYGAAAQPAIAARMAPHLKLVVAGVAAAALGLVTAMLAVVVFPSFGPGRDGLAGAVVTAVAAALMLGVTVLQLVVWRRAMASWRGERAHDLHRAARLSWVAHLVSYGLALAVLLAGMEGSAYAGWSSAAAVLLALSLLLVLLAQVLAGVQYLRPSGPPGTIPAHLRRLRSRPR
jgi:hypothetical protein